MHELLSQVLNQRDLSKAGDLFSVDDKTIVNDLSSVLGKIQEIASHSSYLHNDNDQSVVEICIARVTSAIRETGTIEQHAPALVKLLESSLSYNLKPSNRDEDPPHAKIAADVISCIFLNYTKKEVMKLALPVAVKFLHKGNKVLSRNLSSYLSLAALGNAELLAMHIQPIIDSVISGNYTLARVLPRIYAVNKEPIHDHVMALVSLLPLCENPEKQSLLNLFGLIARNAASLLEPSLPQLSECLTSPATAMPVLQVFKDMAYVRAQPFTEYLSKIKMTADQQPATLPLVVETVGAVGRLNEDRARDALIYLVGQLSKVDHALHGGILKEIKSICDIQPQFLREHIGDICKYSETTASNGRMYVQHLKQDYQMQLKPSFINHSTSGITVVKVGGSKQDIASTKFLTQPIPKMPATCSRPALNVSVPRIANNFGGNRSMTSMTHSTSVLGSSYGISNSIHRLSSSQAIHGSVKTIGSRPNIHTSKISSCGVTVTTSVASTVLPSKSISGSLSVFHEDPLESAVVSVTSNFPQNEKPDSVNLTHSTNAVQMKSATSSSICPSITLSNPSFSSPMHSLCGTHSFISPSQPKGINIIGCAFPAPTLTPTPPPLSSPSPTPPLPFIHSPLASWSSKSSTSQRISTFEPYPMRDAVQHFCEKHLDSIKQYMQKIFVKVPLPVKCTIEERKNKKHAKLNFTCHDKGLHCLYGRTFFTMKTRCPRIWIHLMFLALQARSPTALSTRESSVSSLKTCWDILKSDNKSFLTLVFSPFPSSKDQESIIQELRYARFFDVFEYNGATNQWRCFLCNHPDRAVGFLQDTPVIEGQLKEKKGKWKLFRRWRTRYFTLSGAHLSYRESKTDKDIQPIDISQIRSIKAISTRGARSIPKAFEIFTTDKTYVLKAKDSKNTEEWVQYLSIVVARSHSKEGGN